MPDIANVIKIATHMKLKVAFFLRLNKHSAFKKMRISGITVPFHHGSSFRGLKVKLTVQL